MRRLARSADRVALPVRFVRFSRYGTQLHMFKIAIRYRRAARAHQTPGGYRGSMGSRRTGLQSIYPTHHYRDTCW
jgi:hypothetical protein